MKHYDESELIEVHFLPGENDAARIHLAQCDECASRMSRVAAILETHAAGPQSAADTRGEFFWQRQSSEIRRKIARDGASHRFARFASIAAMLIVLVGGSLYLTRPANERVQPAAVSTATATASASVANPQDETMLEDLQSDHDAWSSDQLKPYHDAVEWESWLATTDQASSGGTS